MLINDISNVKRPETVKMKKPDWPLSILILEYDWWGTFFKTIWPVSQASHGGLFNIQWTLSFFDEVINAFLKPSFHRIKSN